MSCVLARYVVALYRTGVGVAMEGVARSIVRWAHAGGVVLFRGVLGESVAHGHRRPASVDLECP